MRPILDTLADQLLRLRHGLLEARHLSPRQLDRIAAYQTGLLLRQPKAVSPDPDDEWGYSGLEAVRAAHEAAGLA